MYQFAQDEITEVKSKLLEEEKGIVEWLLPVEEEDDRNVVLEVKKC